MEKDINGNSHKPNMRHEVRLKLTRQYCGRKCYKNIVNNRKNVNLNLRDLQLYLTNIYVGTHEVKHCNVFLNPKLQNIIFQLLVAQ